MNNAILPNPFDLTLKYSQLLTATFVCLLYSTGMPFMNLIICLIYFSNYYFQKCILLRVSSQPIKYNQIISENVLRLMPIAVILRAGFAVWTLTCPDIFPVDGTVVILDQSSKNNQLVLKWTFNQSQEYFKRISSYYIGSAVFILILVAYCSKSYVKQVLKALYTLMYYLFCCCFCHKDNKVGAIDNIKEENFGNFVDE